MVSCATVPEPSATVKTLVVGQIVLEAKNFQTGLGGGFSINGTTTDGLTVYFTNYQTKETTPVPANDDGYFASAALPPGNYFIANIALHKKFSSGSTSEEFQLAINPSSVAKFILPPGGVANLGKIVWVADAKKDEDVVSKADFAAIQAQFATGHHGSGWLTQPWNPVTITPHLDLDLDPAVASPVSKPASSADFKEASLDPVVRQIPPAIQALEKSAPDRYLQELVVFLAKGSPNAFVTVKRFHDWVADTIAYDAPSFLSGNLPNQDYKTVLATKLAVCEGYAALFKKLCDLGNIPCAVVDGYSRGYGTSVFDQEDPTKANHAWNLVQIHKDSYLVDTTWDSGYLQDGRFTRAYSTGYLFTDPNAFIHSHFPSNPQYQLLAHPVDAAGFAQLADWNSFFYNVGIANVTKLDRINRFGNEFTLEFAVPPGVDMMATVEDTAGNLVEGATFRQKSGSTLRLSVALPKPGNYVLRLFEHEARDPSAEYPGCGELGFVADKVSRASFPKAYTGFGRDDLLLAPLGTPVVAGQTVGFRTVLARVPYAVLMVGDRRFPMVRDPKTDNFSATVTIPAGATSVILGTSQLESGPWEGILEFPVSKP